MDIPKPQGGTRTLGILWRQWKRSYTRAKKLMKAGLTEERALRSAFNQRGPWWNSGASHMNAAYYLALRQTQGGIRTDAPDWQPWLLFFLRSLAEQVRRLEKKVERERIVLAALPALSLQIVEFAREHGRITMAESIKLTGAVHVWPSPR